MEVNYLRSASIRIRLRLSPSNHPAVCQSPGNNSVTFHQPPHYPLLLSEGWSSIVFRAALYIGALSIILSLDDKMTDLLN